jgi:hypothetical protein
LNKIFHHGALPVANRQLLSTSHLSASAHHTIIAVP